MMNLVRDLDAQRINAIVNDPSVYPFVHGMTDGPIDLTTPLSDQRNVALVAKWGGVILAQQQAGIYEIHVQALPEGRGSWTADMAQSALQWAFTNTEAVEIFIRARVACRGLVPLPKRLAPSFSLSPNVAGSSMD